MCVYKPVSVRRTTAESNRRSHTTVRGEGLLKSGQGFNMSSHVITQHAYWIVSFKTAVSFISQSGLSEQIKLNMTDVPPLFVNTQETGS